MAENKGLEIREGRTELVSQHGNETRTFIHPSAGPNTFTGVKYALCENGLYMPDMAETASLVEGAWQNPNEKYSKGILDLINSRWLWANNGVLWTPKGVYVQDNPNIEGDRVVMGSKTLKSKLSNSHLGIMKSHDGAIRYTEYGFKLGEHTPTELGKNRFVILLAGEEGAEKLARVAEHYSYKPKVWGLERVSEDITRVSALFDCYSRLLVNGYDYDDYRYGHAFGVLKTGEASRTKSE